MLTINKSDNIRDGTMTYSPHSPCKSDGVFYTGTLELTTATPTRAQRRSQKLTRRLALLAISASLIVALGCVAIIIGTASAQAANLAAAAISDPHSIKQAPELGLTASGSIVAIAIGTIFALTRTPGR